MKTCAIIGCSSDSSKGLFVFILSRNTFLKKCSSTNLYSYKYENVCVCVWSVCVCVVCVCVWCVVCGGGGGHRFFFCRHPPFFDTRFRGYFCKLCLVETFPVFAAPGLQFFWGWRQLIRGGLQSGGRDNSRRGPVFPHETLDFPWGFERLTF